MNSKLKKSRQCVPIGMEYLFLCLWGKIVQLVTGRKNLAKDFMVSSKDKTRGCDP